MTGIEERLRIFVWDYGLRNKFIVNEKDGSILVQIPAGEFEMGEGRKDDEPKHKVYLDTYYIGVYCITNRQYKRFVEETGHRPPDKSDYGEPIWNGKSYPEAYAEHPVVCVDWKDAGDYCRWAGLSLPTEAQWEKAARGPDGLTYPWGNKWDEGRCRNGENREGRTTCEVYGYPGGASGYGIYNMSGNVWEWCVDLYEDGYCKSSPYKNPKGPDTGKIRVFRGGSWSIVVADIFRAAIRRGIDARAHRLDRFGFRPCLAPGQQ